MARKQKLEEVLIYPARWRVAVNVVLYGAFVFTGFALLASPDQIPRLIGAGVVVYFGLLLIYALRRLLVRAPSLIINSEGVFDNASITGVGGVHWHEITGIERRKNYLVHHIAVSLRDREAVVARVPIPRRWLVSLLAIVAQDSANITPGMLDRPLDEVEELLERYHAEFGSSR